MFSLSTPWRHTAGETVLAPSFLNLGTRWRWVANLKPQWPYPRKAPWYPLNKKLGRPQSLSGQFREEKISHPYWDSNPRLYSPELICYADYATTDLNIWISLQNVNDNRKVIWCDTRKNKSDSWNILQWEPLGINLKVMEVCLDDYIHTHKRDAPQWSNLVQKTFVN
jgi:hypothetical protein